MELTFTQGDIITSIWSIIGISVTVWLFVSQIDKKLNLLLGARHSELSKEQVINFSIIYVDYIINEMHRKVDGLILELMQDQAHKRNHLTEPGDYMLHLTEKVEDVRKAIFHIRSLTTEFYLVNRCSFKDFIERIHENFDVIIIEGEKSVMGHAAKCFSGEIEMKELRLLTHQLIEEKGKVIKDIIKENIIFIYKD